MGLSDIKNVQYWNKRADEMEAKVYRGTEEFETKLDEVFKKNVEDIDKQIDSFFIKYVEEEGVLTYSEAMKNLTREEKAEIRTNLQNLHAQFRKSKDKELLARIKKLEAQNLKTRLDGLKIQMEARLNILASGTNQEMEEYLGQVYQDVYNESLTEYADGLGVVNEFDTASIRQVEEAVNYPYSGSLFRESVWTSTDKLNKSLVNTLQLGLGQGKSIDKLAKELKKKLNLMGEGSRAKGKKANYDYRRIVRTEAKFIQERAKSDANKAYGFAKYKVIVNINERTCPRCKIFADKVYTEEDRKAGVNSPPFHPQCRCTSVPYYEEIKRVKEEKVEEEQQALINEQPEEATSKETTEDVPHKIVQGKNMFGNWKRREDAFEFEIDDIVDQQGFNGLPRIVDENEFREAMKKSGFYAERTYSANSEEILEMYQSELYGGQWYIACTDGGAQYGQGMYCASTYDLSSDLQIKGIGEEMKHYQELNVTRGNELYKTEGITLAPDAKIIKYQDLVNGIEDYATRLYDADHAGDKDYQEWMKVKKRHQELIDMSNNDAIEDMDAWMEEWDALDEKYFDMLYDIGEEIDKELNSYIKRVGEMDMGVLATSLGYDAINSVGHGQSGSYTVILNRTKVLFNKGGSLYGN